MITLEESFIREHLEKISEFNVTLGDTLLQLCKDVDLLHKRLEWFHTYIEDRDALRRKQLERELSKPWYRFW